MDALEPLDPYYTRFRKRFLADAAPWARDNILWSVVVLVVPPIAAFLHNPHTPIDWTLLKNSLVLYTFALAAYSLAYLSLTAERLDADRQAREQLLTIAVAEREQTIREREDSIHVLTEKPKRSSAEQHDYDKAMKALELLKDKGLIAMRHIRSQGSLTFGVYNPLLPPGLSLNDTLWVYRHWASEGLLTCKTNPGNSEQTFAVPLRMEKVLDELLF